MAISITLLGSTFDTNDGSKTVTATPAAGDLIVIVTGHTSNSSTTSPTDDNSSGTYTLIAGATRSTNTTRLNVFVRDATIGAAVSTVFTHAPGTTNGGGLAVFKVTGASGTGASAVAKSGTQNNGSAAGTPTVSLGSAASAANAILAAMFNSASPAAMTPPSGYAEPVDTGYSSPLSGIEIATRDSGETASSVTWGGASASAFCALAIELIAAGGTAHSGAAALNGAGTLGAAAVATRAGVAALNGTGALSAAGVRSLAGSTALPGSGTLAAGAARSVHGQALLTGSGSIDATGARGLQALASLGGAGTLTPAARREVCGAAQLLGVGTLTAAVLMNLSVRVDRLFAGIARGRIIPGRARLRIFEGA